MMSKATGIAGCTRALLSRLAKTKGEIRGVPKDEKPTA